MDSSIDSEWRNNYIFNSKLKTNNRWQPLFLSLFLMLFVTIFTITLFILINFESLIVAFVASFLLSSISIIFFNKREYLKKIGVAVAAFLLALCSLYINYCIHTKNSFSDTYYDGYAIVSERTKQGKYVVQTNNGYNFFFHSDKELKLGSELFLSNKVIPSFFVMKRNTLPSPGELVNSVKSGAVFDYNKRQVMKGINGIMYNPSFVVTQTKNDSWITQLRQRIADKIVAIRPGHTGALVLGMVLGDRSLFDEHIYNAYVDSSLVHIVAVSGGNIVILTLFLSYLLFFIPFYLRLVVISCFIVFYAMLCGADSSVIRATIMALLSLLALFFGREVSIWRLLGYAWVAMLARNPLFLIYDVGFLLSFSAIIGILSLTQQDKKNSIEENQKKDSIVMLNDIVNHLNKKSKDNINSVIKRHLFGFKKTINDKIDKLLTYYCFVSSIRKKTSNDIFRPTLGASLGVLPIIIYFIGGSNILGIVANILIALLVPVVMILGGLLALVYGYMLFTPFEYLFSLLASLVDMSANFIQRVSLYTSKHGLYLTNENPVYALFGLTGFVITVIIVLLYEEGAVSSFGEDLLPGKSG